MLYLFFGRIFYFARISYSYTIINQKTHYVQKRIKDWLVENVDPCPYGVGDMVMDAMNNLLERLNQNENYPHHNLDLVT
jgi:hypothetical protein